ncbi:MAG: hypothetical protein WD004_08710 [Actinomycetota bacterium]
MSRKKVLGLAAAIVFVPVTAIALWIGTFGLPGNRCPGAGPYHCSSVGAAQSSLRNGIVAAQDYEERHGSFTGFDPEAAEDLEPALTWTVGAPRQLNEVQIVSADESILLLATDRYDGWWCIAETHGIVFQGTAHARTPEECIGGWG